VPRVKRGTKRRNSRKKTLTLAKGFFLTKSKLYRAAQEAVEKSLRYGYKGRRLKKRDFRSLWIVRIGAACRASEISYSRFMSGLKKAGIELNRKTLAEMALNDAPAFSALIAQAKAALESEPETEGADETSQDRFKNLSGSEYISVIRDLLASAPGVEPTYEQFSAAAGKRNHTKRTFREKLALVRAESASESQQTV
jgi:large subunit ribosomal protein L20